MNERERNAEEQESQGIPCDRETQWIRVLSQMQEKALLACNAYTERYGLTLSPEDTRLLLEEREQVLKKERRIEFGESILPELIRVFCDSEYLDQENYAGTLIRLQEIFYQYKNEMNDEISDEELLNFMKEQFDTVCAGSLEYLESTCLDIFAQAVRAGYRGSAKSRGIGEFAERDPVTRWDRELYLEALADLF